MPVCARARVYVWVVDMLLCIMTFHIFTLWGNGTKTELYWYCENTMTPNVKKYFKTC